MNHKIRDRKQWKKIDEIQVLLYTLYGSMVG